MYRMKYIGAKELAMKWGVTERRVRLMCQEGRIEGAMKLGWSWSIPADVPKPSDGRVMRHYKTSSIRLGSIDVTALNTERAVSPIGQGLFSNPGTDALVSGLVRLGSFMDGRAFTSDEVQSVFSSSPSRSLSYAEVLKISAFRSVLVRAPMAGHQYLTRSILALRSSFTQGWDDRGGLGWRDGHAEALPDGSITSISFQMETFFQQYEREWRNLHPVYKSVILLTQLVKEHPFDSDNALFAIMASSAMLLSDGFLPPLLDEGHAEELRAAMALAVRRHNYEDLARVYERLILASYRFMDPLE